MFKKPLLAISHLMMPKSWIPSDSWISSIKRLKYSDEADENVFVTFGTVVLSVEVWLLIAVDELFRSGRMVVEINEGDAVGARV